MNPSLQDLLRTHGLRVTPARQAVFQTLRTDAPITIRELRARTAGRLDTASLYRTLTLFRQLGVIQDVVIAGCRKVELTDTFTPHHHHMACHRCGRARAIRDTAFEQHIERLAAAHGFTHDSHSFEITGMCPECAAAAPTAGGRSVPAT